MIRVTVGTYICGRWVFGDGFANMGWGWGKPRHYLAVFALALFIFGAPVLLENRLGLTSLPLDFSILNLLGNFLISFILTIPAGFGEESGWRAYLLPRLARRYTLRQALLLHAFIWWAWHIPAMVRFGSRIQGVPVNIWLSIAGTLLISLLPAMMNAILFAYVWMASRSLVVASVYHAAYDEVRDALQRGIGFGPLVSIWEMACTLIFGAILLWKADWSPLHHRK
jgi:membrane protease YdiL (CAAX protease family)